MADTEHSEEDVAPEDRREAARLGIEGRSQLIRAVGQKRRRG